MNDRLWLLLGLAIGVTYLWRCLGLVLSSRIRADGAVLQWVSCVTYAMLAGLIARMVIMPYGALGETPMWLRVGALCCAFAVYYLAGRRMLASILIAVGVFSFGLWLTGA